MEKMHFATLQISDALAEQLSRQDEEDLSIREYIQLSIHSKVRKLESELERCRQEVETLEKISSADKAAAAGASDEIAQVQRIAEAKERRLQHELELSEATRQELENQIKALVDQVDGMKEEQRRNEEIYSDQRVERFVVFYYSRVHNISSVDALAVWLTWYAYPPLRLVEPCQLASKNAKKRLSDFVYLNRSIEK
ncbi:hypothetical protein PPTG_22433 [Phytophthora nicotianae INRA-310]|uniref:Uncharacterized protein n=1 Tax=Phytophthora nicotianae (strain INRA-310) TaxID=761204 RepID=W2QIF2_PHYN3|nr:hypothetical protein PPTG_22433 [Phytophthora nicotianae INRA-310]ETN12932.1 hypothetical protein PPTG_22433 [Phytophthora nicotianae INRA-310]